MMSSKKSYRLEGGKRDWNSIAHVIHEGKVSHYESLSWLTTSEYVHCFFCGILYYMNNIHLQPALLKKFSLIPLMSCCSSNVNGHLVVLDKNVFSLLNKLNPYPEVGNLTLFLNPIAYMMWLEQISVDFASSSLQVLILYIRFSSELTTIQSNQAMDLMLLTENFQICWCFFSTWDVY